MPATNKRKRAYARITATAQKSNAATFRNIQRPYHRTCENRGIATDCDNQAECSNGYKQKRRKHGKRNSRLFFILYALKRGLILYSLPSRDAINSLLLTTAKCN
jgi:hypothetical protein